MRHASETTPSTSITIDMGSSDPVSQKPYPITMKNYQWVKEEIEKLLAAEVILSSRSSLVQHRSSRYPRVMEEID